MNELCEDRKPDISEETEQIMLPIHDTSDMEVLEPDIKIEPVTEDTSLTAQQTFEENIVSDYAFDPVNECHSCNLCGKMVEKGNEMIFHTMMHKVLGNPQTVDTDDIKTEADENLMIQTMTPDGKLKQRGPYCAICNKKHNVTANDVHYSCPVCKQMFYIKKNMKKHMKLIHGVQEPRPESNKVHCDECGKEHAIIPGETEHFTCDICNSKFHTKRTLQKHISTTHEIKKDDGKQRLTYDIQNENHCGTCKKPFQTHTCFI